MSEPWTPEKMKALCDVGVAPESAAESLPTMEAISEVRMTSRKFKTLAIDCGAKRELFICKKLLQTSLKYVRDLQAVEKGTIYDWLSIFILWQREKVEVTIYERDKKLKYTQEEFTAKVLKPLGLDSNFEICCLDFDSLALHISPW